MNAVLVFDPSNDLLFVKSNSIFRHKLVKYARLNGLLSPAESAQVQRRRDANAQLKFERHFEDTSKRYTDTLMLLLTPYVASLRLNNELTQRAPPPSAPSSQSSRASPAPCQTGRPAADDLLAKFMSSININHECKAGDADEDDAVGARRPTEPTARDGPHEYDSVSAPAETEFNVSTLKMPIECLQDCQVVYCSLYDFIFIHMQQLESVSSFKMRLLHKRIRLFARLALCLFGQALGALQSSASQALILRRAYDFWFEHQFEPDLFLEAAERLIVGSHISRVCQETLRKVSVELRAREQQLFAKSGGGVARPDQRLAAAQALALETHQHALLFSSSKLVSKFSCLNSRPLLSDDLILLLLLVKTFNRDHANQCEPSSEPQLDASARRSRESQAAQHTYRSHYAIDPHTHQILPSQARTRTVRSRLRRRRARASDDHFARGAPLAAPTHQALPQQFPIFLAALDGPAPRRSAAQTAGPSSVGSAYNLTTLQSRVYVPHMIRFVVLTKGMTLVLISELSSAYLNLHLSRAHRLLLTFSAAEARAPAGDGGQLKLSQLARVNDCLGAIRNYFHAPDPRQLLLEAYADSHGLANEADDYDDTREGHRDGPIGSESLEAGERQSGAGARARNSSSPWLLSTLFRKYFTASARVHAEGARGNLAAADRRDDYAPADHLSDGRAHLTARTIFDALEPERKRLCRHLSRRLAELAQNNVQTYVRQTFGMPLDEHKREALLSSVCASLRDSFAAFVLEPQLERLTHKSGNQQLAAAYLRHSGAQLDHARLVARHELSDYLDYLAVKASCNVTLGAPLTQGLSSISSFVYVDRGRQELIMAPLGRSAPLNWRELMEGDFQSAIERHRRAQRPISSLGEEEGAGHDDESDFASDNSPSAAHLCTDSDYSRADSTANDGDDDEDDRDHSGEESSAESEAKISVQRTPNPSSSSGDTSESIESIIYNGPAPASEPQQPARAQKSQPRLETTKSARKSVRPRGLNEFLGTSQDVLSTLADCGVCSSSTTSVTTTSSRLSAQRSSATSLLSAMGANLIAGDQVEHFGNSFANLTSNQTTPAASTANMGGDLEQQQQPRPQPSGSSVDANLVKGFTSFIYNRLAGGQTSSFAQNAAGQHLAYFMWFKHQEDGKLVVPEPSRRLEVASELGARFKSLPNVTSDDFFANLTRSLLGGNLSGGSSLSLASSAQPSWLSSTGGTKRRVKVYCQLRELDPNTGCNLLRRQLSRVREEDEEEVGGPEEELEFSSTPATTTNLTPRLIRSNSINMNEQLDFGSFMSAQRGSRGSPTKRLKDSKDFEKQVAGPVSCSELFCIHDANLVVYKNQPAIEAQRLAQRLASLAAQNQ